MPRTESVISPPIRGAARTLDMAAPDPSWKVAGTSALGGQWLNRQGIVRWAMGSFTGFGVPPAGTGWTLYRGRVAHLQTGNGVSGGFFRTGADFAMTFPTDTLDAPQQYDFACWRVVAILAFQQGIGSGDIGLEVAPGTFNYDIITGPLSAGFRLAPDSDTSIAFQVRQATGGALTVNQTIATNIDIRDWHAYEMRFIGATAQRNAVMKAFLNNQQVASFNWGPGTLLPSPSQGGNFGFMIGVGNRGANGAYRAICGLQVQSAATEAELL